jgi:hypothetical protein
MIWQTFFISFFLNNRTIFKKKLNSILSSEPLPELKYKPNEENNTINNLETISYKPNFFNPKSGYDCRFNISDYENQNHSFYTISRYFHILDILKILESDTICTNNKIDVIEQYNNDNSNISKYVPNININNLLDDW